MIWEDLATTITNNTGDIISKSPVSQIQSDTIDGMNITLEYFNPSNSVYIGGKIQTRATLRNFNNKYFLMNETNPNDNRAYLEAPEGSIIEGSYLNYYGNIGTTSAQDAAIPTGYVRYYRDITDSSTSFPQWNIQNNVNDNRATLNGDITPPVDMPNETDFHIKTGIVYRKWNASVRDISGQTNYRKQDIPEWSIYSPPTHSTGGTNLAVVDMGDASSISDLVSAASYWLPHSGSMVNNGKRDITNMTLSLNQPIAGSARINYGSIQVTSNVLSGSIPGFVKVELVIKNTITGKTRVVAGGHGKEVEVPLPILETSEFVDNVLVVPMGTDGKTEGSLPSGNGLRIQYRAKNWSSEAWPDGLSIPTDKVSPVTMGWTLTYDNEKEGMNPTPITQTGSNYTTYYALSQTTRARAQMVSSQAKARAPGDIVGYTIQGYNELNAVGNWMNPEIGVAIPKVLELQNPNEYKDFVDSVNKLVHKNAVKVTLVSSDDAYNYYKFNVSAIGYKNNTAVSFEIPVNFKVANGTLPGTYPIPFTTASHNIPVFVQLNGTINNLNATAASKLGYSNTLKDTYSAFSTGNTDLTIASSSKLNGFTAGRKNSLEVWSNLTNFAVENDGKPQMQASIANEGNTSFESIRLYDILPSEKDGRGSTGDISFTDVESKSDSTVYYTLKAIADLPKYGTNLQEWTSETLISHGFSTVKPTNEADITAIYIDFGATVVEPNNSLDTILNFKVPETGSQTAVNQFQYSAKEQKTAVTLNAQSQQVAFSTEVAQVAYNENLPSTLPAGVTSATNTPEAQSELIELDGTSRIKLSDTTPTLPGYIFEHWVDHADLNKTYKPGDTLTFTKESLSTTIQLDAVWKATQVKVTYNENYGAVPKKTDISYAYGANIDTSKVTITERKGYEFLGWSLSQTATTAEFTDGTKVDFLNSQTVYGIWKEIDYTVVFDNNGGIGTIIPLLMTYDVEKALSPNTFVREGYLFQGWATSAKGTVVYQEGEIAKNLTDKKDGQVTLYAIWKKDETSIVAKNSTLYVGDTWAPKDNFVSATDRDGASITYDKVAGPEVTGVDTKTVGKYPVTYSYGGQTTTVTVEVVANQETLEVKDVTIYAGEDWTAKDNFVSATKTDGKEVTFKEITVTDAEKVDTSKEGEYLVTYSYGKQTKVGKVIVLKNQTSIKATDSTIYVGDTWKPADNFVSATDKDGSAVPYDKVTGPKRTEVDTKKVGKYPVTYSYGGQTTTVNVEVAKDLSSITVKDSTIKVGTKWVPGDNFVSATDRSGKELAIEDLTISGTVNTEKPGVYKVTYQLPVNKGTDNNETAEVLEAVAEITVVEEKVTPNKPDTKVDSSKKAGKKTTVRAADKNLPQTGEANTSLYGLVGVGIVGFVLLGVGFKKRKRSIKKEM